MITDLEWTNNLALVRLQPSPTQLWNSPPQASSQPGLFDAWCLCEAFEINALKPVRAAQKEKKKKSQFYIFKKLLLFSSQLSFGGSLWAE